MCIRLTGAVAALMIAFGGTATAEASCSMFKAMQDFVRPALPAVEEMPTEHAELLIDEPTTQHLDELAVGAIDERDTMTLRSVPAMHSTSVSMAHSVMYAPYGMMFQTITMDVRGESATYDLHLDHFVDVSGDTQSH